MLNPERIPAAFANLCHGGVVLAVMAWLGCASPAACAQAAPQKPDVDGIELQTSTTLKRPPQGAAAKTSPIILRAREVHGRPDLETIAEGDAELRRGDLLIRADRLGYNQADDLATASGHVHLRQDGNVFEGPEVQLKIDRFEGFFRNPTYYFGALGAGGSAERIDFIDRQHSTATRANYTSCGIDGSGQPAWMLSADSIKIDLAGNEGTAENAVLRFYGVPILAAPSIGFPLSDERKSGWLPPSLSIDSKSGPGFSIPYYWNIAPDRDATFTPSMSARRGPGLETEVRYLDPDYHGESQLYLLPHDRLANRSRYSLDAAHDQRFGADALLRLRVDRVSDDDYWKDFRSQIPSLTPRLLASDLQLSRPLGDWTTYGRALGWQVLQTTDPTTRIEAPYERLPQIGARYAGQSGPGLEMTLETEFNRFVTPSENASGPRADGNRLHAIGSISRPYITPGWTLVPKLAFNAASYELDDPAAGMRQNASRVIPTLSVDSAWVFERDTSLFGHATRQTLEPRLLYVNTPYVRQDDLPNYDSAAKDFNFESIYSTNEFSGVDRVSDAHELTAGVTTRFLDPATGAETLRLGIVQRYLFREQRVTSDLAPSTQRFSDVLLLGSTSLVRHWNLDATLQYSPETKRIERSVVGVHFSPGPFRTVNATYRLARNLTEQMDIGWQWPIYGPTRDAKGARHGTSSCSGSLYGVGRVNYSMRDSRITDSIFGLEYDAGCWVGRLVVERLSTGRSEATTRLLVQLELVGLSRLGSNPLQLLKDNIPGYRMLRDARPAPLPYNPYD